MTVAVRLRPEAEQDLSEAARWYEEQRLGLGQEFLDEALSAFTAIAERPLASSAVYGSLRRALLHRFPFGVFFLVDGDEAVVIGVLHGSRHPRRWKSRL
ncbi:MAG: type II toxin-antitoxin system RelE/ParE family toxin [Steroidobacteraceae bacterium]